MSVHDNHLFATEASNNPRYPVPPGSRSFRNRRPPQSTPSPSMTLSGERRRSVAFVEGEDDTWACFLVTFPTDDRMWHGYFTFRPSHSELVEDEVRTTDIFVEESEAEIHGKARSLGRPLLQGLLDSAIHMAAKKNGSRARLRRRFRSLLTANAVEISGSWTEREEAVGGDEVDRLQSLYESYRLDQVCHFICLVDAHRFEEAVDQILEGERIDFRTKDRVQFAMMVVEYIERRLPLPDFESWARDFLANPDAYRRYTHTLHRDGRLP
jgi:hypothetical protein